jgi:hypothetical protein
MLEVIDRECAVLVCRTGPHEFVAGIEPYLSKPSGFQWFPECRSLNDISPDYRSLQLRIAARERKRYTDQRKT